MKRPWNSCDAPGSRPFTIDAPAATMSAPRRAITCTISCSWRTVAVFVIVPSKPAPKSGSVTYLAVALRKSAPAGSATGFPPSVTVAETGVALGERRSLT